MTRIFFETAGAFFLTSFLACAANPGDEPVDDVAADALTTSTRVFAYAKDDASRIACRSTTNRYFCSVAEARASAAGCDGPVSAGAPALSLETELASCSKSSEIYPTIAACSTPRMAHCGYYSACVERALPCGESGYALGFGERFCTAFRNAPLSPQGVAWTSGVMGCLERALVPRVMAAGAFASAPATSSMCSALFEEAFASHPGCYTRPEHSICFLPPSDLTKVLSTIGAQELFTARTSSQIVRTISLCVGQLTREIFVRLNSPFGVRQSTGEELAIDADPRASFDDAALAERKVLLEQLAREYESHSTSSAQH